MIPDSGCIRQAVLDSVSETFETMIFTHVDITEADDIDSWESSPFWASVDIVSPLKGYLLLVVPEDLAIDITKTLYGWQEAEEPAEIMVKDALAEMTNTITGRLMERLTSEDKTFELGLPETGDGIPDVSDDIEPYYFLIDDIPFAIFCFLATS